MGSELTYRPRVSSLEVGLAAARAGPKRLRHAAGVATRSPESVPSPFQRERHLVKPWMRVAIALVAFDQASGI